MYYNKFIPQLRYFVNKICCFLVSQDVPVRSSPRIRKLKRDLDFHLETSNLTKSGGLEQNDGAQKASEKVNTKENIISPSRKRSISREISPIREKSTVGEQLPNSE